MAELDLRRTGGQQAEQVGSLVTGLPQVTGKGLQAIGAATYDIAQDMKAEHDKREAKEERASLVAANNSAMNLMADYEQDLYEAKTQQEVDQIKSKYMSLLEMQLDGKDPAGRPNFPTANSKDMWRQEMEPQYKLKIQKAWQKKQNIMSEAKIEADIAETGNITEKMVRKDSSEQTLQEAIALYRGQITMINGASDQTEAMVMTQEDKLRDLWIEGRINTIVNEPLASPYSAEGELQAKTKYLEDLQNDLPNLYHDQDKVGSASAMVNSGLNILQKRERKRVSDAVSELSDRAHFYENTGDIINAIKTYTEIVKVDKNQKYRVGTQIAILNKSLSDKQYATVKAHNQVLESQIVEELNEKYERYQKATSSTGTLALSLLYDFKDTLEENKAFLSGPNKKIYEKLEKMEVSADIEFVTDLLHMTSTVQDSPLRIYEVEGEKVKDVTDSSQLRAIKYVKDTAWFGNNIEENLRSFIIGMEIANRETQKFMDKAFFILDMPKGEERDKAMKELRASAEAFSMLRSVDNDISGILPTTKEEREAFFKELAEAYIKIGKEELERQKYKRRSDAKPFAFSTEEHTKAEQTIPGYTPPEMMRAQSSHVIPIPEWNSDADTAFPDWNGNEYTDIPITELNSHTAISLEEK